LTKIAIVVMVVLMLIATAIFVSLTTTQANYKTAYQREKERAQIAAQTARDMSIAAAKSTQAAQARIEANTEALNDLRRTNAELSSKVQKLDGDIAEMEADVSQKDTQIDRLSTSLQSEIETRKTLTDNLNDVTKNLKDATEAVTKLKATIARQETDIEGLTQMNKIRIENIRQLREELAARDKLIDDLRSGTGVVATDAAGEPMVDDTTEKVLGQITAIEDGVASIDIGKANGVDKGMRLIVYRGSNFVGYLNVSNVTTTQAAGLITLSEMAPQVGDSVTNKLAR
jgi:Tfp pilus assembly protein FimV